MPSFAVAITPVLLVLVLNFIFSKYVIPAIDTVPGAAQVRQDDGIGRRRHLGDHHGHALIACVVLIGLTWKRFQNVRQSVTDGALGSMLPILNVGSEVAYGAVIASLASFAIVRTG
jgi:H+/gluconate symporter-like permease